MTISPPDTKIEANNSPWHDGEKRIQASVGLVEQMEVIGRKVIRDYMPEQHRQFYRTLPYLYAGVVDPQGHPWATLLVNPPGFIESTDSRMLSIQSRVADSDPALAGFRLSAAIGFLGLEPHTRRRNRINGHITALTDNSFCVAVEQTMGNCPKYIQLRQHEFIRDPELATLGKVERSNTLNQEDRDMITHADSFYVASYHEKNNRQQVDVSHRGGKPGFIKVDCEGRLIIPDFFGNMFFNTLGNISESGRAGLLFVDDRSGDILQLSGTAEVILDPASIQGYDGAERYWTFSPLKVVRRADAVPLRWHLEEMSPYALAAGEWPCSKVARSESLAIGNMESRATIEKRKGGERQGSDKGWLPMRVTKIVDESRVIRSFYLEKATFYSEKATLSANSIVKAGQFLPIRVPLSHEGITGRTIENTLYQQRTYTLSSSPSDSHYRISVKREGLVSQYLHDSVKVGDFIDTKVAQGLFYLDDTSHRPIVMLAAGVGITPMISMVREMVARAQMHSVSNDKEIIKGERQVEGGVTKMIRPLWLFHAAGSSADRAFDDELTRLTHTAPHLIHWLRTSSEVITDSGSGQFYRGRIDIKLLKQRLPFDDYDFYLCGPPSFMQDLYDGLRELGISNKRIYAESFGAASLRRHQRTETQDAPETQSSASEKLTSETAVSVSFSTSQKVAQWLPDKSETLLDLAEKQGIEAEFSCRSGQCGACKVKLLQGEVSYLESPVYDVAENEILLCCAMPAKKQDNEVEQMLIIAV